MKGASSNSRWMRTAVNSNDQLWVLRWLLSLHSSGIFSNTGRGHQKVDLKQTYCQIFLQQRWVYLGSGENCNPGSVNMVSCMKIPTTRKGKLLGRRKKEAGKATVNRAHSPSWFSWLCPCQKRRGAFLLSIGQFYCHKTWKFTLLVSQFYSTEVSVYQFLHYTCSNLQELIWRTHAPYHYFKPPPWLFFFLRKNKQTNKKNTAAYMTYVKYIIVTNQFQKLEMGKIMHLSEGPKYLFQ